MDQLQDRQDVPIWNAIEAKNYKQALKLVDKRLAKKPTEYLEAVKIYIRSLSPQIPEKAAVLINLEGLVGKKPSISDITAIEIYHDALEEVLPESRETWGRIIGELRWQCVKSTPKNEDLSVESFKACLSKNDLDHARQIANTLEKNFPLNHSYVFWNITTMFMFSTSPLCPENQRKIWGGLAFGQIGKLAGVTRQAADPKKLPVRSVQTPQELLLLQRITEVYGNSEQRLEQLQNSQLGPESTVAKGDWELWRIKLKLMEDAQQWQELFDTTSTLLNRARTKNSLGQISEASLSDWIVWEAFLRSAIEINTPECHATVRAEVEAHLDPLCGIDKSWKRNASLAWVKLSFDISGAFSDVELLDPSVKVVIIVRYLQEYGAASTAYNDMRQFVELLNSTESQQLLLVLRSNTVFEARDKSVEQPHQPEDATQNHTQDLCTAKKITQAINVYKLRYLITCSLLEKERGSISTYQNGSKNFKCGICTTSCGIYCGFCLESLAEEAINAYRVAINDDGKITETLLATDRHPADDFCILAAMCLMKLALMDTDRSSKPLKDNGTERLLQATALLEDAWSRSKSNFQISLMLIRLYTYLGAGSLAMRAYNRLALKQVQLDTLSYTLFDRLSTLHPHASTHSLDEAPRSRTLIEHLEKQHKLYRSARQHVRQNIWLSFKHGSYNSIFEMREVSDRLEKSLAAAMSVIETTKIARLTEPNHAVLSQIHDILSPNAEAISDFYDTNDYDSFPNFESTKSQRFEQISRFMPTPSTHRTHISLLSLKLRYLLSLPPSNSGESTAITDSLSSYLSSHSTFSPANTLDTMTRPEDWSRIVCLAMTSIVCFASLKTDKWQEGEFQDRLEAWNRDLLRGLRGLLELVKETQDLVPAFAGTLHALYVAYEIGKLATDLVSFLEGKGKVVHEFQVRQLQTIGEAGKEILEVVSEKCSVVKKGLDEGGWIDSVLESALPDGEEGVSGSLRGLMGEDFMEEWAGIVVESWRDSVVGFSYLK